MKIVGLSFDHMHVADLLRQVYEHPTAEIIDVPVVTRRTRKYS